MAPTIQTNGNASERDKRTARPAEKRSELICRVKYCNTLPDIPFDPKFITYPFESTRFIQYNPTSLERNYKYEVLTEHDLGVEIDLINKDTYAGDVNAQLDPADEKLLEEDVLTPQDSKRSRHHARSVSWLRRTEYISTEQTRFQPQTVDKVEAKVGYSIKKNFKEETLYMDRESQIKAIEKTFEDNKKSIERHYSKPNVVPVEILPVFPDFKLWKYPCAQVIFDSDPAPTGRSVPAQIEEMSQAMIRGVMDESGEQFVAYFLPLEETLEKRRRDFTAGLDYADDEEYEYKMAREYNWNVKSKASKGYEENYFLVMRQDGVYYNELETRVRLSKRRQKVGQQPNNTRLIVRHRPLNANEFKMQRYREKQLEPPGEEDEDEEEEEEEEEEPQQEVEKAEEREESENEAESRPSSRASSKASSQASSRKSRSRSKSSSRSKSRSRSSSKSRSVSRSRSQSLSLSSPCDNSRSGFPQSRNSSKSPSDSYSGSPVKSQTRQNLVSKSNSSLALKSGDAKSLASPTAISTSASKSGGAKSLANPTAISSSASKSGGAKSLANPTTISSSASKSGSAKSLANPTAISSSASKSGGSKSLSNPTTISSSASKSSAGSPAKSRSESPTSLKSRSESRSPSRSASASDSASGGGSAESDSESE